MIRRLPCVSCLVPLLLGATSAGAQAVIVGTVRDSAGVPILGAEVSLRPNSSVTSDASGAFIFSGVAAGMRVVVARKIGFVADSQSPAVAAGDTGFVTLILRPQSTTLPQVDVTAGSIIPARLEGFERRRGGRSGGQFITRETIERRGSSRTTDFLRGIPGIQMVDSLGVTIAISSRGPKLTMGARPGSVCSVRIGVDGQIKDPTFGINLITPSDIHGIEVYAGAATIPPEFNSSGSRNAQCGLIMIWTRSR